MRIQIPAFIRKHLKRPIYYHDYWGIVEIKIDHEPDKLKQSDSDS